MNSNPQLGAILHLCRDAPKAAILKVCGQLEVGGGLAIEVLKSMPSELSKGAFVRLQSGLEGTGTTSKALALALRSTLLGIEVGRSTPDIQLVWTGPDTPLGSSRETLPQMLEMIGRAQKSILLVTFAAFRAQHLMKALEEAHRRGVAVFIIVESAADSAGQLSQNASKAFPKVLIEAECLWVWPLENRPKNPKGWPGKLHAKCLVIDEKESLVSSANLTDDAMERNIEVGLRCSCATVAVEISSKFRSMVDLGILKQIGI